MFKQAFLFVVFAFSVVNCMKSKPLLLVKITEIEYETLYEVENDIYKDCGNLTIIFISFLVNFFNVSLKIATIKGSETGKIKSVTITDCNQAPCIFKKGNNYTLTLSFDSSKNVSLFLRV